MSLADATSAVTMPAKSGRWSFLGMGHESRLFRRYFTVIALGTCGILLPAIVTEMVLGYLQALETVEHVQAIHADAAAAQIASRVSAVETQIREIADLPWGPGGLGDSDRRTEFQRLLKRVPAILEMARYDSQGRETLYVSRVQEDRARDPSAAPLAAADRPQPGDIRFGPIEFRDSLEPFVATILHEGAYGDGGWVRAVIDLKHVADFIARLAIEGGGTAYLADDNGMVIAHPRVEFMLRPTPVRDPGILEYIGNRSARKATRAAVETVSLDGSRTYSGMATIGTPPWTVVIEQPERVVTAPLRRELLLAFGVLAGALLLSFVVSLWYARRLSQPILALEAGAAAFGRGDFDKRVQVRTGDEIELLADQFNRMAGQLREYTDSLERKVAEKTAELEAANRHKSEFVANMSHELRTPLNAVIGFSEVLKERLFGDLNPKQMEYTKDIYESGQHLLSLINDILDLSKVEAGRMTLDIHEFDVRAALQNCVMLIRDRATRQKLKLEVEIDEAVREWAAEERKFKQVVLNLLSNAVKFTPAGGIVTLRARIEGDWLAVAVSDTGIGIGAEDRAAIFEEFRQLRPATGAKHEGTGLGLSLSRRLVELHGGRLTVASERGRGSTFTARFPRTPSTDANG